MKWVKMCHAKWGISPGSHCLNNYPGTLSQIPVSVTHFKIRISSKASQSSNELQWLDLTHWGRDKMVAISQTTFSNAFSWMKMYKFRLRFHWIFSPRVESTMFMKTMRHIGHFRWLGPNVSWEISQIWIEYIKPIGQMSDESWKFFGYTESTL